MLNRNIKKLRINSGLSQEELALKLHVVRQTVSKWENGLSVPDSEMLIELAKQFDTSVSTLVGEEIREEPVDDIKTIANKLEIINLQLAERSRQKKKIIRIVLVMLCLLILGGFVFFWVLDSCYLSWDYSIPEYAVSGTILHGVEFLFVRIAPVIFILLVTLLGLTFIKK